jgi:hypothetical protein
MNISTEKMGDLLPEPELLKKGAVTVVLDYPTM